MDIIIIFMTMLKYVELGIPLPTLCCRKISKTRHKKKSHQPRDTSTKRIIRTPYKHHHQRITIHIYVTIK